MLTFTQLGTEVRVCPLKIYAGHSQINAMILGIAKILRKVAHNSISNVHALAYVKQSIRGVPTIIDSRTFWQLIYFANIQQSGKGGFALMS